MKVEDVDKIGKGRIWSGSQAKDRGLVDELGGLDRAIVIAKQLSGIPVDRAVHIVRFPEEKTFFEILMERHQEDSAQWTSVEALVRHLTSTYEPLQVRMPFDLKIY
jgi:protease-4